jgi:hypothetical protein
MKIQTNTVNKLASTNSRGAGMSADLLAMFGVPLRPAKVSAAHPKLWCLLPLADARTYRGPRRLPFAQPAKPRPGFDHRWRIRARLPERHGHLVRVLARGSLNNCLVEFEDGFRVVTSASALRRAGR